MPVVFFGRPPFFPFSLAVCDFASDFRFPSRRMAALNSAFSSSSFMPQILTNKPVRWVYKTEPLGYTSPMSNKPHLDKAMCEMHGVTDVREIPGFPGYAVSSDGKIFSCRVSNKWRDKTKPVTDFAPCWHEMKPSLSRDGYLYFPASGIPKKMVLKVHVVVLLAFVGPRPEGFHACHNNGVSSDNRLENLRWDTPSANAKDARNHGRRGSNIPIAKITEEDVSRILDACVNGTTPADLAIQYGISKKTINEILNGNRWVHVPRPPELARQVAVCGNNLTKWGLWVRFAAEKGLTFDEYAAIPKRIVRKKTICL